MNISLLAAAAGLLALTSCAPPLADALSGPPVAIGPDQCLAPSYQSWVGRDRSTLPPRPEGEIWRMVCSTCAVTMDYVPYRLNIVYDAGTNIITQMKCG